MKNTTYTFDKAPSFTSDTPQIPWITNYGVDYNLIFNKP